MRRFIVSMTLCRYRAEDALEQHIKISLKPKGWRPHRRFARVRFTRTMRARILGHKFRWKGTRSVFKQRVRRNQEIRKAGRNRTVPIPTYEQIRFLREQ